MPWQVIKLQAIATRDEGWRKPGEPLWPERWPLSELEPIRLADATVWEASYQQEPSIGGGYWFAGIPLNYYDEVKPKEFNVYMVCDPALRKHKKADYTTILVFGTGADRNYYILDLVRIRADPSERASHFFRVHRKWHPIVVGYEEYGLQSDVAHLRERMDRENYRFGIIELGRTGEWHNLSKEDRIRALMPIANTGRIWLPRPSAKGVDPYIHETIGYFVNEEYAKYPASRWDDCLDVMSRMLDPALNVCFPLRREYTMPPPPRPVGTTWMSL